MWNKWLAVFGLVFVALVFFATGALADTPSSPPAVAINVQGQAVIISNYRTSELRLKTTSSDSSGWLLEISADPVSLKSNSTANPVWNITGTFTLGKSQQPMAVGTATGWVDSNGTGDVVLSNTQTSTSLDLSFAIAASGSVTGKAQGQWPAFPAPVTQPTASTAQPASHFFWYLSRSSAIMAYILLFINLFLGIGLKARYLDKILSRWRAADLHQFTALLAMPLIFLHIFSILGDSYFNFGLKALFIPGASPYRPFWDGLGIIGFYVLLAVSFSCYIRKFIGQAAWKGLHFTSFIIFFVVLVHSIKSGTDITAPWTQWLYFSTGTIIAFLFLWRFLTSKSAPGTRVSLENPTLSAPN